jgi:hypothetical protein
MPFNEYPVTPTQGPQGARGPTGPTGPAAESITAFSVTTANFTQPAPDATVTVLVDSTLWMGSGQQLFIENGGYYVVTTVVSDTELLLTSIGDYTGQAAESTVISSGSKVSPGGYTSYDASLLVAIGDRVTTLENTVVYTGSLGENTFYSPTAPSGLGEREGDIWYKSDDRSRMYRYDGAVWVDIERQINLALDTVGQITETKIADGAISAPKIAANSITAAQCVTSELITTSAMIKDGIIIDAHVVTLSAAKITTGNMVAVNMAHDGKIYHSSHTTTYFDSVNQNTQVNNSHLFPANATAFSSGGSLDMGTALTFYGPGHASAAANTDKIVCPNSDGEIILSFAGVLNGYTGTDIALVYRKNGAGNYQVGGYAPSGDGTSFAHINGIRKWGGFATTDYIEFWIAPVTGSGTLASPVTCSAQLDVKVDNW